jgi:diaminopimelate decarboxylase
MAMISEPTQYTPHYKYRWSGRSKSAGSALFCEGVSLSEVAESTGTPAYVYSGASVTDAYQGLDRAFGALPHTVCYAVKANSNLALLKLLADLGSGFDIVSGGELDRLRRVGVPGDKIVFSGVGKTREEIRAALRYCGKGSQSSGISVFNVESEPELEVLLEEAQQHVAAGGERVGLAIRVNPDVKAGGHRHISTGKYEHKFGVTWEQARRMYLAHKDSKAIVWKGISSHIGSQILSLAPYKRAVTRVASYVRELAGEGIRLETIDAGGGLGIRYTDEKPLDYKVYASTLAQIVRRLGCRLLIEPGRSLVGPAGVLLTRVIYVKKNGRKTFVIVDAAMNDLIRPVLYEAIHPITKVTRGNGKATKKRVDVVGPVCETGDFLARDWPLPEVKTGDVLAVWAAGAYGFAEASNYNSRRRAAEVLVEGNRFRVVRDRESYEDLVRGESI